MNAPQPPRRYPGRGQALGVLMLETRFPRPVGDIGNAASFAHPVLYRTVPGATPATVLAPAARVRALLPAFIEGARALEAGGAAAITTSCGFLVLAQAALAEAVRVPVLTSALHLVPLIRAMIGPGRAVGIVTADAGHLTAAHLAAAGIAPGWQVAVRGLERCPAFAAAILADGRTLDVTAVRSEVVAACRAMQAEEPGLGAILFECTNLPPHAGAVRAATGLEVWSILDVVGLLMARAGRS